MFISTGTKVLPKAENVCLILDFSLHYFVSSHFYFSWIDRLIDFLSYNDQSKIISCLQVRESHSLHVYIFVQFFPKFF